MENFLMEIMEFLIEHSIIAAAITLIVVGVSTGLLYASGLYRNRQASIITTMIVAVITSSTRLINGASVGQWVYYLLFTAALAPPWVSSYCYRKRLKEKGYSGTV